MKARVFCGLHLEVGRARRLMEDVRAALGRVEDFRLPRAEGLHATLYFLGDVERERLGDLIQFLAEGLEGARAPELRLTRTGAFPGRGRERVLWMGVEGELEALHTAVLAAVQRFGEDTTQEESRPYRPHITVARPRSGRVRVPEAFYALESGARWQPREVTLFESVRGDGPARYEPLERFSFVD